MPICSMYGIFTNPLISWLVVLTILKNMKVNFVTLSMIASLAVTESQWEGLSHIL